MADTVLIEEMTWREIKQAMDAGKDTVILVAAAIEQHGPHLPTATDTIIGYAVAKAVAKKLGNALVAPVIRPALITAGISDQQWTFTTMLLVERQSDDSLTV